jgi:hypothetical protein
MPATSSSTHGRAGDASVCSTMGMRRRLRARPATARRARALPRPDALETPLSLTRPSFASAPRAITHSRAPPQWQVRYGRPRFTRAATGETKRHATATAPHICAPVADTSTAYSRCRDRDQRRHGRLLARPCPATCTRGHGEHSGQEWMRLPDFKDQIAFSFCVQGPLCKYLDLLIILYQP